MMAVMEEDFGGRLTFPSCQKVMKEAKSFRPRPVSY